jgi:hypothetical protein
VKSNDAEESRFVRIGVQLTKFVEAISTKLFPDVPVKWRENLPQAGWLGFKTIGSCLRLAVDKRRFFISADWFLAARVVSVGTAVTSKVAVPIP